MLNKMKRKKKKQFNGIYFLKIKEYAKSGMNFSGNKKLKIQKFLKIQL